MEIKYYKICIIKFIKKADFILINSGMSVFYYFLNKLWLDCSK